MYIFAIVVKSESDPSSKSLNSPLDICSLVIGGSGDICAALLWSTLKRMVLTCRGVSIVSENPWN